MYTHLAYVQIEDKDNTYSNTHTIYIEFMCICGTVCSYLFIYLFTYWVSNVPQFYLYYFGCTARGPRLSSDQKYHNRCVCMCVSSMLSLHINSVAVTTAATIYVTVMPINIHNTCLVNNKRFAVCG
jgi:hypothetical protein